MHNIQFDFSDLHLYGPAFFDYLRLRKRMFVDELKWDIPHNATMEMDQYDTPMAQYSLVMRDGRIVGGARAMATTSSWGAHTYMLRDAFSGKLPHIPPEIMTVEIASPAVWECTRIVISDELTTSAERAECMEHIIDGIVGITLAQGASEVIGLSSVALMRWLRGLGYPVGRIGQPYRNGEDGRQYAVLHMQATYSNAWRAREAANAAVLHMPDWSQNTRQKPATNIIAAPAREPMALSA
jgi:N-acyl-L-homoserine lactone synthetase